MNNSDKLAPQSTKGFDEFYIRTAVREDAQTIFNFIVGIATYEKMQNEIECTAEQIEQSMFDFHQAEAVIGYVGEKAVGFALFFHNFSTFKGNKGLYLEDLFITPEYRGCGYGKRLLLHLKALACERGCSRMEWTCLDWNEPAIAFYKSIGAIPMDEWTIYRLDEQQLHELNKA